MPRENDAIPIYCKVSLAPFLATAGANGDVTNMLLPGGYAVSFSGHDVRHADGRQLQRLGLQPHVTVAPTIAGLARGENEVLAAAEAWLQRPK